MIQLAIMSKITSFGVATYLAFAVLEKITGKNDKLTPLQFVSIYCHPDFSIFPPKTHLEVELRLYIRIV